MRLFFLTLFLSSILYAQGPYDWKVTRAIDGDTVEMQVTFLPTELSNKLYVRIWGIDTPEKGWRAHSVHEQELGTKASEFTKNTIANAKEIRVSIIAWDKFGGRVLGDLIIDGKSLRQLLLDHGFAREYYGDKKQGWD